MPPTLIGTYAPPSVRKGDVVLCLYRDGPAVVTGLHDGRIPWPRVRAVESRGGSGLWVDEELARAIRTESAEALMHWFGVSEKTAWNWRRAFGVAGQTGTPGSKAAHLRHSRAGAEAARPHRESPEEQKRVKGLNVHRWKDRTWTAEQLALLGTDTDEVIAARVGRSVNAVSLKRHKLGIPAHYAARSHRRA